VADGRKPVVVVRAQRTLGMTDQYQSLFAQRSRIRSRPARSLAETAPVAAHGEPRAKR
jgi:hypothetical protein